MRTDFLKSLGLSQEAIDSVMRENGKDVKRAKDALEDARGRLSAFEGADVEGLKNAAAEWEKRYHEETAALKARIDETARMRSAERLCAGEKFSSEAAKQAFLGELSEAGVQENDADGYAAFRQAWGEKDPGAFAGPAMKPPYAAMAGSAKLLGQRRELSEMGYFERLELKKKDPKLYAILKG